MRWIRKQIKELAKKKILILLGEIERMKQEMAITPKWMYRYAVLDLCISIRELKIAVWAAIGGIDL